MFTKRVRTGEMSQPAPENPQPIAVVLTGSMDPSHVSWVRYRVLGQTERERGDREREKGERKSVGCLAREIKLVNG